MDALWRVNSVLSQIFGDETAGAFHHDMVFANFRELTIVVGVSPYLMKRLQN